MQCYEKEADLARHVYRLRPGVVELHIAGRDVGLSTKEQERMSGLLRDFIAREGIEAQEFPTTTDQIRVYDMSPEGWGLIKFPNVVLPNPHFVLAGGEGTRPFLIDILSRSLQEDVDHLGSLSSPAEVIGRTQ